jgi:integrase
MPKAPLSRARPSHEAIISRARSMLHAVPKDETLSGALSFDIGATEGLVFRAVNKGDRVIGDGITPQAIYNIIVRYAGELKKAGVAPHDLRRTFAKLAHKGGAAIDQIQLSLGHESIQTTEEYLGVEQDLTDAPCDHLGLRLGGLIRHRPVVLLPMLRL